MVKSKTVVVSIRVPTPLYEQIEELVEAGLFLKKTHAYCTLLQEGIGSYNLRTRTGGPLENFLQFSDLIKEFNERYVELMKSDDEITIIELVEQINRLSIELPPSLRERAKELENSSQALSLARSLFS